MSDPLVLAKCELAEIVIGQNTVGKNDQQVVGKSVCIDCGHEESGVIAHARTAWVMCGICGTQTGMFIYRGAKAKMNEEFNIEAAGEEVQMTVVLAAVFAHAGLSSGLLNAGESAKTLMGESFARARQFIAQAKQEFPQLAADTRKAKGKGK